MPGINVIVPAQWKDKVMCSDRNRFEDGAAELPLVANLAVPDGTPVNIASNSHVAEITTSLAVSGVTLGNCVNGATAGAEVGNVIIIRVGDKLYGRLTDAVPSSWKGQVVGLLKGATNLGYKFVVSGFITGTNVFTISSIKDAVVGDTNAIIEVIKSS